MCLQPATSFLGPSQPQPQQAALSTPPPRWHLTFPTAVSNTAGGPCFFTPADVVNAQALARAMTVHAPRARA